MQDLLQSLGDQVEADWKKRVARHSRTYRCGRCENQVFFRNSQCLSCRSDLGFLPDEGRIAALQPGPESGTWLAAGRDEVLKFCGNRTAPAACNWMMLARNPQTLCMACRLTRTIPNLADPDNARYWAAIEIAKRRLVSQLIALNLPVRSKVSEDPERGLMFDFLRSPPGGPRVMTGHAGGLITINVEEADDAKREQIKHALREPYRTLLGHFRHEVGHYYWDRLVWDTPWLEPFRRLFGDERASYAEALKRNYEQGPPADWADAHISAYATMHPWEDWAETWAHYLHVVDSLGTAMGFGLEAEDIEGSVQPFTEEALYAPDDPDASRFLAVLNGWIEMTMVLNELARSMGQPDFYPFVMSRPVVAKLQFIQIVVRNARTNPNL
ncbi:putative zinc-binding metallopeptidase [Ramlibacter solisilvae]|uniref:DNA polymerase III subunit gamma/tau n=1 Tax=Ramlibacter tataouinensis TaxID=94132 RepID=A0A127JWZ6_9BURK|nr:putative zinc-binding metallopeptidase [Ramlibacter tataouinensis]AMO24520.1 DNA polymerase III subunit gamma/tau [Ramlibacter tataouinensis]